jgi:hypothetical protein
MQREQVLPAGRPCDRVSHCKTTRYGCGHPEDLGRNLNQALAVPQKGSNQILLRLSTALAVRQGLGINPPGTVSNTCANFAARASDDTKRSLHHRLTNDKLRCMV